MRPKIKLALLATILSAYLIQSWLFRVLLLPFPKLSQRAVCSTISFWAFLIRFVLGIKVKVIRTEAAKNSKATLSVSNHPSYLDFFVVPAVGSLCYVSPIDLTGESSFFNVFSKAIGCIFVNRKSRENQEKEKKEIAQALENGLHVHFFPEARTTDGTEILRFRRPLFEPAIMAESPLRMVTINYLKIDGRPVDLKNKDQIHWYRQNPLGEHFFAFASAKKIEVEVIVEVRSLEELNKTELHMADACHDIVEKNYKAYK